MLCSHVVLSVKHRWISVCYVRKGKNRSAVTKLKKNVSDYSNTAIEPAGAGRHELPVKPVKLQGNKNSCLRNGFDGCAILDYLEADLNAIIAALKEREEDLQHAENQIVLDHAVLNHTKQQLVKSKREFSFACAREKVLEKDLMKANGDLASQSKQIENLKVLISGQDQDIIALQSALLKKEKESKALQDDLLQKNKYIEKMNSELESLGQLLKNANRVIESQKAEIGELQMEIRLKEDNMAKFMHAKKVEQEMLRAAETNLERQFCELSTATKHIEDLTELALESSNNSSVIFDDFKRVNVLLSTLKSELTTFHEYIALRKSQLTDKTRLNSQLWEINKEKLLVASYAQDLDDAKLEIESKQRRLAASQAQLTELYAHLSFQIETSEELQVYLNRQKYILDNKNYKKNALQMKLLKEELTLKNLCNIIQIKERELVEARIEIQHLKSKQASLLLFLEQKDHDFQIAQQMLFSLSNEILQLQNVLKCKENQLIQLEAKLAEKENYTFKIQRDLEKATLMFSEASAMIQGIFQMTSQLVSIHCKEIRTTLGKHACKKIEACSPQAVGKVKENHLQESIEKAEILLGSNECFDVFEKGEFAPSSCKCAVEFFKCRETDISYAKDGNSSDSDDRFERNEFPLATEKLASLLALTDELVNGL